MARALERLVFKIFQLLIAWAPRRFQIASTLVCALLFALASPAHAAFKSSREGISPEQTWNPQPLADDIILPMPCGLSLALRAVDVPSGALIRDKSFAMGISNPGDQDRQIYERQFSGHIAAPFTLQNLPPAWQAAVKKGKKPDPSDAWYFMGKYETSKRQWDAVMNAIGDDGAENPAMCPAADEPGGNLPVTGVTWFEVQHFLNKYNAWLVKNHVDLLPAFSGTRNIAFLRLPTEEEWEFAARGGSLVPPEWWAEQDIFPFAEGKALKDYAVTSGTGARSEPLGIGSRAANPLGLHDTAGNAGEMVDGFFRMSIADMANGQVIRRLHGAAGGILTKGGSFRSADEAAMPGARDEMPLYTTQGPTRQPDLGFRIAVAGLNIPNAQRLAELRKEAGSHKLETQTEPQPEMTGRTPLEMAASLASLADEKMKPYLEKLREALQDQESAQLAQDSKNLEQTFRSLLYQAETLRAFAFRYSSASQQLDKIRGMLSQSLSQENRSRARQLLADGEKDLKDYMQSLRMGANYYKSTLDAICQKPSQELDRLFDQARREYGSSTIFDEHMRQNLARLSEYIAQARKKGINSLDTREILRGLLPEKHFRMLDL